MAVEYDFYETSVPNERDTKKKKKRYHARVVPRGVFTPDMIAKAINQQCTLTEADVKAVLSALSYTISGRMMDGYSIHLEGIGYFSMTITCPPVRTTKEIRAESISFKSIAYKPEKSLKNRLKLTHFERAAVKKHSKKHTDEEVDKKLEEYFKTHDYIMREDIQNMFGLTRITAIRKINKLRKEGKIERKGYPKSPFYLPAPGWYGKSKEEDMVKG